MTTPAAVTKSIGLLADAPVVMVFASPFGQLYRDTLILPTYRDCAKTHANPDTDGNSPYHRAVIKNARTRVNSASRIASNKTSYDKTDNYHLSVYTATHKYPAEYFCLRANKKLALVPVYFKNFVIRTNYSILRTYTATLNLANFLCLPCCLVNDLWWDSSCLTIQPFTRAHFL
jgi:hypothetical protein